MSRGGRSQYSNLEVISLMSYKPHVLLLYPNGAHTQAFIRLSRVQLKAGSSVDWSTYAVQPPVLKCTTTSGLVALLLR